MHDQPQSRRGEVFVAALLFAVLATVINGLQWGVGDHGIIAALVGDRLPGDLLEHARDRHPSLQWPLLAWVPAPLGWNALHLLALAATGAALFGLGRRMMPDSHLGPWIALALVAPANVALGGAPTLDSLLVPRGLALPLELLAVSLALERRWLGAWLLVGIAVDLHAPSGVALGVGMLAAWWPERDRWWTPGLAVFAAAPVLVLSGAAGRLAPMDLPWWGLAQARLAHHVDPGSWAPAVWIEAAIWLLLAVAGLRTGPAILRRLGLGLLGWMLVAGLAGLAFHVPLLVNLEPWQVGRFVVIGGALGLAASAIGHSGPRRAVKAVAAAALVLVFTARADHSGWHPGGPAGEVRALADWAQTNTDAGHLFVVPPELGAFRPLARRPVFGTFQDGGELQFDRALASEWARRMEALCGCAPFADPLPPEPTPGARRRALQGVVRDGYEALADEVLGGLARDAGAHWIVRRVGTIPPRLGGQQAVARFGALAVYPVVEPADDEGAE